MDIFEKSATDKTTDSMPSTASPRSAEPSKLQMSLEEEASSLFEKSGMSLGRKTVPSTAGAETGVMPASEKGVYQGAIDELSNLVSELRVLTAQWQDGRIPPLSFKRLESPWTFIYALTYILLVALAEILTAYYNPELGGAVHSIIMFAIFGHAALVYPQDKQMSGFLMATSFAPLIRIVSLSAPLSTFSYIQWFLILSIPLFVGTIIFTRLLGFKESDLGINFNTKTIHWELAVGLTGLPLGFIEFFILRPGPLVYDLNIQTLITPVVILVICTGFIEELIFRGLIQYSSITVFGRKFGILFPSLLFGFLHIGDLSLLNVAFALGVAFAYSLVVLRTQSILGVSISHGLTNCILFLVMPLYF